MTRERAMQHNNKLHQEQSWLANRLAQELAPRASEDQMKTEHQNRPTSHADKSKLPKQKRWRANHRGRQDEKTPFFKSYYFAQNPKERKKPRRLTAGVSCGGWERGQTVETEKAQSQENA